ncbi:restriction endonuclease subunit S [Streptomyces anulatus]
MGELPEGWVTASLGDLAETALGKMLDKKKCVDAPMRLYLRNVNVQWGRIDVDDLFEMSIPADELDRFSVRKGDLLVCEGGEIGRCAIWERDEEIAYQKALHRVRAFSLLVPRYLRYYLEYAARTGALAGFVTGSTIKHLPQQSLREVPVPLPPLAEQRRIVEALEEQLSRLDAGIVLLEAARLRGAVLQKQLTKDVISGRRRTTEEVGDADELLSLVDAQVAHMAGKKRWAQIRDPEAIWTHELPSGWRWRTLGSLCVDIQYGTSAKTALKEGGSDVPVIRMGNIQDGRLDLGDLKYLPAEHIDIKKTLLRDGDLLFNRTNSAELVGKSAVYSERMGAAVYASYLIRCRFAEGVESDWVNAVVNSDFGRRYIASVVTQQVGQANVNSAKMALMPIPVPPQPEQRTALKVLRDWEAALARPQLAARVALKRSKGLRSAILRSAFSGELAPQDPGDEPADTLLARIAAERESAKPARRAKRAAARPRKRAAALPSKPAPAPTSTPSTTVQQELFQ